jgi:hypothetical protein
MQTPSDKTPTGPALGRSTGDADGAGGSNQGGYSGAPGEASSAGRTSADERGVFGPPEGNRPRWGRPDQGYGGGQFGGRAGGRGLPVGGHDSAHGGRPYGGENFGGTSGYGGNPDGRYAHGRRTGAPQTEFDPDYQQWRTEHLDSLDDDYRHWRQDRYAKFVEEFDRWRKQRQRG